MLADPFQHPGLDGSGNVLGVKEAPARLSLGATFTMSMKMGLPYSTTNVVVEFEENRRIAWHHFAPNVWRYELNEVDGATTVTESFNYDNSSRLLIRSLRFPSKNRRAIEATLKRIDQIVTSSP